MLALGQKGRETTTGEQREMTKGAAKVKGKTSEADKRSAKKKKGKDETKPEAGTIEQAVEEILSTLSQRLSDPTSTSGTINDFLKLISFQRELEDSRPKEIIVRWVEPSNE
jgi:hypothetical protein